MITNASAEGEDTVPRLIFYYLCMVIAIATVSVVLVSMLTSEETFSRRRLGVEEFLNQKQLKRAKKYLWSEVGILQKDIQPLLDKMYEKSQCDDQNFGHIGFYSNFGNPKSVMQYVDNKNFSDLQNLVWFAGDSMSGDEHRSRLQDLLTLREEWWISVLVYFTGGFIFLFVWYVMHHIGSYCVGK